MRGKARFADEPRPHKATDFQALRRYNEEKTGQIRNFQETEVQKICR